MDGILKPQYVPRQFEASRASLWLNHCQLEHGPTCNDEVAFIDGMRLIDCERRLLVDTEPSRTYEWLALSYVWGGPDLSAFPDTPRTITDAIKVTKQLGYRYLWVDQYCIDQGNEESKKDQLNKMDQIYRGAVLTIVAVMGTSKHYGLPGVSLKRSCREANFGIGRSGRSLFFSDSDPEIDIRDGSPWYQRAWTYQEGYLSRRLLVFTDEQTAFYCNCDSWMESWGGIEHLQHSSHGRRLLPKTPCALFQQQLRLPRTMNSYTRISDQFFEFLNLASQYTCRALSFDSDALNAFAGVMQHLRRAGQEVKIYDICGLPFLPNIESESDQLCYIFIAISWSNVIKRPRRRSQFPSWSWAGWADGVQWAWDSNSLASLETMMREVVFGLTEGEMQPYRKTSFEQLSSVTRLGFQAPVIPASRFSIGESWRPGMDPRRFMRIWGNQAFSDTNHTGLLESTPKSFLEKLKNGSLTGFLLGSFHDRSYILVIEWQGDGQLATRVGDFQVFSMKIGDDIKSYEWRSVIMV
ncbi:heterokaryon incompatibility protein-domain-containing protein [Paraphoma chrysanthemicola]|uniref:Heterokaryon incompatibility protein-domain-containing protein n=1 Tax=Paraphoma chrysanthemicola TaxID=798071 RepID=A0A8K0W3E1_9PLEO|nr:heterokaryon incompatibility protein-domain-containing protein [Paraphoma chrysanthemicola]